MRVLVGLTLVLGLAGGVSAQAPPYVLAQAEDLSEGDFFKVRFVVQAGSAVDAAAAEAIARDIVERRVKRRALHVADVRILSPETPPGAPPAAVVVWALGGDPAARVKGPAGNYSGYRYTVELGSRAAALARRLDSGQGLPLPAAAPASPAPRPTPAPTAVVLDLGPLDRRAVAAATPAPAPVAEVDPALRAELLAFLTGWRAAWESKDLERYLALYATGFRSGTLDLPGWRAQKTRVFATAGEIHLDFRDIEVSGQDDRATLRFVQDYRSTVRSDLGVKTLVLVRLDGAWKILREDWQAR